MHPIIHSQDYYIIEPEEKHSETESKRKWVRTGLFIREMNKLLTVNETRPRGTTKPSCSFNRATNYDQFLPTLLVCLPERRRVQDGMVIAFR